MSKLKSILITLGIIILLAILATLLVQNNKTQNELSAAASRSTSTSVQVTFTGTLDVLVDDLHIHEDDKGEKTATHEDTLRYFVSNEKERIEFKTTEGSLEASRGDIVTVTGTRTNNILTGVLTRKIPVEQNQSALTSEVDRTRYPVKHKTAVFLVDFLDSGPKPFTKEEAQNLVFNGQFQNFYREQSYNKIQFVGNVYDWITLPRNSSSACAGTFGYGGELDPYIVAQNINLANYDHITFIFNCSNDTAIGGSSSLGKWTYWYGSPEKIATTSILSLHFNDNNPPKSIYLDT